MTDKSGIDVTQPTVSSNGTNSTVPVFEIHPGITAIIGFGVAILIIIVYLYYENVIFCVKTLYFRRRPPDTTSDTTTEGATPKMKTTSENGSGFLRKEVPVLDVTKALIREPALMCECGQIHLLKDCVNRNELKPYQQLLNKIATRISPETARCDVIDELPKGISSAHNGRVKPNGSEDRVEEEQHSEFPLSLDKDDKPEAHGSRKSDSGDSSPKCVTPLIQVKSAKTATAASLRHADAGARPKERMLKEAVS